MGSRGGGSSRARWLVVGVVAVLFAGAGVAVISSCSDVDPVPRPVKAASPLVAVPEVEVARVVASWLDRTAAPSDLESPKRRAGLVGDFAAAPARRRMADQLGDTAASFRGEGAAGLELRAVPLGYRVRSVVGRAAVVETEQLVLQASPGTTTVGLLATGRIDLVQEDRWRITDARITATPLSALGRDRLATIDARFTGFRHVP